MSSSLHRGPDVPIEAVKRISMRISEMKKDLYENLTPWQRVQIARHTARPYALDYVSPLCVDFQELHGDRTQLAKALPQDANRRRCI